MKEYTKYKLKKDRPCEPQFTLEKKTCVDCSSWAGRCLRGHIGVIASSEACGDFKPKKTMIPAGIRVKTGRNLRIKKSCSHDINFSVNAHSKEGLVLSA